MKMNLIYITFILLYAFHSVPSLVNGNSCQNLTSFSGGIYDSNDSYGYSKCWIMEVPEDYYARLYLTQMEFRKGDCSVSYVEIAINRRNETYTICQQSNRLVQIIALNDVTISHVHRQGPWSSSRFGLQFTTENLVCIQKDNFRCNSSFCIPKYQVCNEVKDCENGTDEIGCEKGIMAIEGVSDIRNNATNWLKNQRTQSHGWGKNTHRAITALYLSKAMTFQGDNLEEELIAKQLELQTSVALLRNASDPISISELSMFVNALSVTCHNPRHFYGYDLLQILYDRLTLAKSPVPSAYLTLCSQNWKLSEFDIKNLITLLKKDLKYPFQLDVRALAIMALTCAKSKTDNFINNTNAKSIYESTIQNFTSQLPDGSFGNVYTTALVTQALISSGQEESKQWNVTAAALYLMKHLESPSVDFLSVYLILPILSGRSLVDLKSVKCTTKTRKEGKDQGISEVMEKLGGKMQIQYSLFIGDQKDVVHTMYLRMPENSSAYDVMRMAEVADSKYKFLHRDMSGEMYIYEIAGFINDPESGKFWLLYTNSPHLNGTVEHHTESPDRFILEDGDHLIMWYRTARI